MDHILHLIRGTLKIRRFSDSEGERRLNDPFDLFGSLMALSLRRVEFTGIANYNHTRT